MDVQDAAPVVAALARVLPAASLVVEADRLGSYCHDEARWVQPGRPVAVVLPRSSEQVSAALAVAADFRVPVVPRGAGTGLSGGAAAVDGCIVVCTTRMDRIVELRADDQLAVVQPGVVTADLDAAAAEVGLWYPPDPSSWRECTVGGNVATDAGGLCCVRYGTTSDHVLGLEAVLADGALLRTGRRTVKGVAGYDLTHLLVGSEGTLGVLTEVTVRLRPRRPLPSTVVAFFPSLATAGAAIVAAVRAPLSLSLLEVMDSTTIAAVNAFTSMDLDEEAAALLVVQVDNPADVDVVARLCSTHSATTVHGTTDAVEADLLLDARRLCQPALEQLGTVLLDDVAVPRSSVPALLADIDRVAARLGVTIGTFGHAGDGNLHPTIVYDAADAGAHEAARRAFDLILMSALELGGTVTGEHGVGVLKAGWLEQEISATALRVHRAVKSALDPAGLMNPGKVIRPLDGLAGSDFS